MITRLEITAKIFSPAQRLLAAQQSCPTCSAQPNAPCIYVERDDRWHDPMPGLHVERYLQLVTP